MTENYESGAHGKNVKGIDEELNVKGKEFLQVGSKVRIIGGSHKGLSGKIVVMSKQKSED